MVVRTVNYNLPNEEGNVNIQMLEGPRGIQGIQGPRGIQGMTGDRGPRGEQGLPGVFFHGLNNVKCFIAKTTTTNGTWTVDYSQVGFTEILNIQLSLQYTNHSQSESPLGGYIRNATLTSANGEAYCVTSAGLLAAMQQTEVKDGTIVNVMVIGK